MLQRTPTPHDTQRQRLEAWPSHHLAGPRSTADGARSGLLSVERGAVVLALVGAGFALLCVAVVLGAPERGYEALAPLLIGPALKATLAFAGALVCVKAGRLARRHG